MLLAWRYVIVVDLHIRIAARIRLRVEESDGMENLVHSNALCDTSCIRLEIDLLSTTDTTYVGPATTVLILKFHIVRLCSSDDEFQTGLDLDLIYSSLDNRHLCCVCEGLIRG